MPVISPVLSSSAVALLYTSVSPACGWYAQELHCIFAVAADTSWDLAGFGTDQTEAHTKCTTGQLPQLHMQHNSACHMKQRFACVIL